MVRAIVIQCRIEYATQREGLRVPNHLATFFPTPSCLHLFWASTLGLIGSCEAITGATVQGQGLGDNETIGKTKAHILMAE